MGLGTPALTTYDSAWVSPSEIQNLSSETGGLGGQGRNASFGSFQLVLSLSLLLLLLLLVVVLVVVLLLLLLLLLLLFLAGGPGGGGRRGVEASVAPPPGAGPANKHNINIHPVYSSLFLCLSLFLSLPLSLSLSLSLYEACFLCCRLGSCWEPGAVVYFPRTVGEGDLGG